LTKSDSKDLYFCRKIILQIDSALLNVVFFKESPKNYHKNIFLISTLFNINNYRNISSAPNQHIRMISKGSCDTEAENSALITGIKYILKCIQIENSNFKLLYFTMLLFVLYL